MSGVKLGVVASVTDLGVGITDLVVTAEQAGLESVFLTEHTHLPACRGDLLADEAHRADAHILDQFTALGAAAAVTSRLKLGTGICVVPQRDPIILAKQVATIDYLSGGRFLFGAGAGWILEEMRHHGVNPPLRWDLMTEQILAMKQIWTREQAEFHGQFVDFDPIWLRPKPVQAPYPPVLVAGSGPRSLRVAAACGNGWAPIVFDAVEFQAQLAELRRLCAQENRPDIEVTAFLWELNEDLMARCARLGIARLVLWAPIQDQATFQSFLDRYLQTADRACT